MGTRGREIGFTPVLARFMLAIVSFTVRKGRGAMPSANAPSGAPGLSAKNLAR